MINDPHTHDFDQFLAFQNADATKVNEFDAEVWLYLARKANRKSSSSPRHASSTFRPAWSTRRWNSARSTNPSSSWTSP
jgi:hypothetical protein